uniref:NADH-ubiquinone oxidoreductase chain 1 n=1 Tax=Medetera sp. Qilemoge-2020 TaxID=2766003 RepID=A0A7H9SMR6_9MUSC|nr:NADH dehydrogenase subunit 1 [Medetera sp. Qilemoge-2020]
MSSLILVICVLVGVAFLTLLERKVLGYGTSNSKVGFLTKVERLMRGNSSALLMMRLSYLLGSSLILLVSNYICYYFSPIFSLFLSLLVWMCMPLLFKLYSFNLGLLFFLSCTSMGVYTVMVAGWSSNSNYALLGGLRAVAQTISYEVSLALIMLSFVILIGGYNLLDFYYYQMNIWFLFLLLPLALVWFASCLAETNRSSIWFCWGGVWACFWINVEYSSGGFALIFLAEYASILFMSMLFSIIFLGGDVTGVLFYFKLVFISFLFIWARGTLPRFRYDKLMYLAWKCFLPFSLNFLMFFVGLKILLLIYI